MSKSAKVRHHIEQALREGVFPTSKLNTETMSEATAAIICALRNKYTEYKFEAPAKLRESVRGNLEEYLQSRTETEAGKVVSVPSMNQALMNQYKSSGSKRQRPEDVYGDNKIGIEEIDNDGEKISQPSSQQSQKRARKSSVQSSSGVGNKKSHAVMTLDSTEGDITSMIEGALGSDRKRTKSPYMAARPPHRLSHLAGLDTTIQQIKELTFLPIEQPQLYKHLGVSPPCGILLKGPSGCGKTSIANAVAGELALPYFRASGPELIGGTSGESEERIRDIFSAAMSQAPSILFIDAIDVIAAKGDTAGQRGMEKRVIAQLLDCIDALITTGSNLGDDNSSLEEVETESEPRRGAENGTPYGEGASDSVQGKESNKEAGDARGHVILLCATNKPDSLDTSLRGRMSRELSLPVPDKESRSCILSMMARNMRVASDVDYALLGQLTPGYVGADLQAVAREAGMIAVSRITSSSPACDGLACENVEREDADTSGTFQTISGSTVNMKLELLDAKIEMQDFQAALKQVQPSATREGFAVVPNVTWADVGALSEVREELLHNLLEPIAHPERFRSLGLEVPAGVLFFGPPGCGKTLLAKAVANQSGANFISVKGPELLNMFVGESESRVRQVFARARASAPCVIFFDELDALCPKRGSGDGGGGSNVTERVVNQLLTELDGLETRKDVYIIAATNRLELIDDAMLRPGRLGKLLYVPLPNAADRVSILRALCRKVNLGPTTETRGSEESGDDVIDFERLMTDKRAEGFSGADCAAFLREAGLAVMREWLDMHPRSAETDSKNESSSTVTSEWDNPRIYARHFESAFSRSRPSVSERDRRRYEMVHSLIKEGKPPIQALHRAAATIQ